MIKSSGPDHTLESLKIFPYVAWGLIIGFGFFVYNITLNLQAAADDLAIQTELSNIHAPIKKNRDSVSITTKASQ